MNSNNKKFIMYFSSIGHHIISPSAKFEIPLVRGEIKKKEISVGGTLDQLK
jgi:hypothetical protein